METNLIMPNPFDPEFAVCHDDDFCFRVAKICKIGLIAEPHAIIHTDGEIHGGEASICGRVDLTAVGNQKLLDKYKDNILALCGKDILASKLISCAKLYLRASQIEKARALFICSYNIKSHSRASCTCFIVIPLFCN